MVSLQNKLSASEAVVVYMFLSESAYTLLVTSSKFDLMKIPKSTLEINKLVRAARPRGSIRKLQHSKIDSSILTSSYELYLTIWKPLETQLANRDIIYIVPAGSLAQFPFYMLLTDNPITKSGLPKVSSSLPWLLHDRYVFSLMPGLFDLIKSFSLQPNNLKPMFIGFGDPHLGNCTKSNNETNVKFSGSTLAVDPESLRCRFRSLPDTVDELRTIGAHFSPLQRLIFLNSEATESKVRSLDLSGTLEKASVIAFATHGLAPGELDIFTDPMRLGEKDNVGIPTIGPSAIEVLRSSTDMTDDELNQADGSFIFNYFPRSVPEKRLRSASGLLLSLPKANNKAIDVSNDGYLSSWEIRQLELKADLVVLSACNTAIGGNIGDDTYFGGLTSAFLDAGAKAIIGTHWEVNSSTASEFTKLFFDVLSSNKNISSPQAFKHSLRLLFEKSPNNHPVFWAPFIYVGKSSKINID